MRAARRLLPPPRDPPGRRDRRHARRPGAAAAARARCRSRAATRSRPTTCPRARCWPRTTQPDSRPVELTDRLGVGLHRARLPAAAGRAPSRTRATRPARGRSPGSCRRGGVGSGGHTTIFRLIRQMELRGHRCAIYVFDPFGPTCARRRASCATRSASTSCPASRREVFHGLDDFDSADVAHRDRVADGVPGPRPPALPREGLPRPGPRARVLRDLGAVDLGRGDVPDGLPLHRLHAVDGRHAARPLRHRGPLVRVRHRPRRVPVRRPGGPRRGDRSPSTRGARPSGAPSTSRWPGWRCSPSAGRRSGPVLFGSRQRGAEAAVRRRGPRRRAAAAAGRSSTARRAVGVVFSLTTHSLVAHEMMASGLPTVELEGDERRLGARPARRASSSWPRARPDAIADAVERLLDDRDGGGRDGARARARSSRRARGSAPATRSRARCATSWPIRGSGSAGPGRARSSPSGDRTAPSASPRRDADERRADEPLERDAADRSVDAVRRARARHRAATALTSWPPACTSRARSAATAPAC